MVYSNQIFTTKDFMKAVHLFLLFLIQFLFTFFSYSLESEPVLNTTSIKSTVNPPNWALCIKMLLNNQNDRQKKDSLPIITQRDKLKFLLKRTLDFNTTLPLPSQNDFLGIDSSLLIEILKGIPEFKIHFFKENQSKFSPKIIEGPTENGGKSYLLLLETENSSYARFLPDYDPKTKRLFPEFDPITHKTLFPINIMAKDRLPTLLGCTNSPGENLHNNALTTVLKNIISRGNYQDQNSIINSLRSALIQVDDKTPIYHSLKLRKKIESLASIKDDMFQNFVSNLKEFKNKIILDYYKKNIISEEFDEFINEIEKIKYPFIENGTFLITPKIQKIFDSFPYHIKDRVAFFALLHCHDLSFFLNLSDFHQFQLLKSYLFSTFNQLPKIVIQKLMNCALFEEVDMLDFFALLYRSPEVDNKTIIEFIDKYWSESNWGQLNIRYSTLHIDRFPIILGLKINKNNQIPFLNKNFNFKFVSETAMSSPPMMMFLISKHPNLITNSNISMWLISLESCLIKKDKILLEENRTKSLELLLKSQLLDDETLNTLFHFFITKFDKNNRNNAEMLLSYIQEKNKLNVIYFKDSHSALSWFSSLVPYIINYFGDEYEGIFKILVKIPNIKYETSKHQRKWKNEDFKKQAPKIYLLLMDEF